MIWRRLLLTATLLATACTSPSVQTTVSASGRPAAQAHPAMWPAAHSPAALTDPQTEARIAAILARMTVEQKVGQMIQADTGSIKPADLQSYPLGSILAGGNSGPYGDERADAAAWDRAAAAPAFPSCSGSMPSTVIPIFPGPRYSRIILAWALQTTLR